MSEEPRPSTVQRTPSIASYLSSLPTIRTAQTVPGHYPENPEDEAGETPQQSLAQAVHSRRSEFTRPQSVRIKVGSWNVAAKSGTEKDVGGWFVGGKGISQGLTDLSTEQTQTHQNEEHAASNIDEEREGVEEQEHRRTKKASTLPKDDVPLVPHDDEVGIYVLGLQEVVDISSAVEAMKPYTDPSVARKYKQAMDEALPKGYVLVAEQQLTGLLVLIWAAPSVAPHIRSVSTASVGTGLMGYMGNKGATVARLVIGESTRLVFINSHMAAGNSKQELERRNWDAAQIVNRTKFEPVVDSLGVSQTVGNERIGDEDFAFWFGDLNYRLEGIPGEDVRRILMLHSRNEYDIGSAQEQKIEKEIDKLTKDAEQKGASQQDSPAMPNGETTTSHEHRSTLSGSTLAALEEHVDPADDPTSLQATLNSLLPHDELLQMQKARKALYDGWREGPITFLPTYKYDVGSVGVFDTGEKRRAPSWCDRILYRTRKDMLRYYSQIREEEESKQKDDELKSRGVDTAANDENMLFDYDPEADGDENEAGDAAHADAASVISDFNVIQSDDHEDAIALENYVSHQRVLSSDHKPLSAVFTIKYDSVQPELRAKVHQEVAWEIDRAENEGRPSLVAVVDGVQDDNVRDFNGVGFGTLRYLESKHGSMTLANTGRSPARFGFVNRPGMNESIPPQSTPAWIIASVELPMEQDDGSKANGKTPKSTEEWSQDVPRSFTLQPGETCNVHLNAYVRDIDLVRKYNDNPTLEDVLVLRVKDGRDHFVPVHAIWQKTCHGLLVDQLIRVPEGGIRNWTPAERSSGDGQSESGAVVRWSAPREIFRLTEAIETRVERIVAEWSMLGVNDEQRDPPWISFAGWPFVEESWALKDQDVRRTLLIGVNDALDLDQSFDRHMPEDATPLQKLEVIAETLLLFLRNLEDGVITEEIWLQLETSFFTKARAKMATDDQRGAILEILHGHRAHSVTYVLLTSMLIRITNELGGNMQNIISSSSRDPSSVELPASPKLPVKRKTLDADPAVARRQLIQKNYAAVFGDVLVRVPDTAKSKKAASVDQRREIVTVFLESEMG